MMRKNFKSALMALGLGIISTGIAVRDANAFDTLLVIPKAILNHEDRVLYGLTYEELQQFSHTNEDLRVIAGDDYLCGFVHCYTGLGVSLLGLMGLPFVLLDQKLASLPPLSKQDLHENGYSDNQIDNILSDGKRLNDKLARERKFLFISGEDTESSIREGLKNFLPDASEEFLDVFSKRLSLVAQSERAESRQTSR